MPGEGEVTEQLVVSSCEDLVEDVVAPLAWLLLDDARLLQEVCEGGRRDDACAFRARRTGNDRQGLTSHCLYSKVRVNVTYSIQCLLLQSCLVVQNEHE